MTPPPKNPVHPNEHRDLGLALLIAEADESYEPVAVVSTIGEAAEIGRADLRSRMTRTERGRDVPCPSQYQVWAADHDGRYQRAHTFATDEFLPGGRYAR